MRTLRLSLAGTVILALLGGLGSVVLAQGEGEPVDVQGASQFDIDVTEELSVDQVDWVPSSGGMEARDFGTVWVVEATDPRISGTWTQVLNANGYMIGDADGATVWSGAVRIDNEAGAWRGVMDGFAAGAEGRRGWLRLQGEGAYEGLIALIQLHDEASGGSYGGVIIPDTLPPVPDPIAPSSE